MKGRFGQTTLAGLVLKTTDAALLFQPENGEEFWIPRRVCLDGDNIDEGDEDLIIANWWLSERSRGE